MGSACGHLGPYVPDVLFWSVILFFTTFFLSSFLKQFKTRSYFPTKVRACWSHSHVHVCVHAHAHTHTQMCFVFSFKVRSTISDFAIFLTIMIMVLLDYLVGVPSPKLRVPDRFQVKNFGLFCLTQSLFVIIYI